MLSNVSHTIECIAPISSDDDPNLAALYSRQAYFDERQQQALGELSSLPRCDTPGCRVHSTPCNSPTKNKTEESSPNSLRKLVPMKGKRRWFHLAYR
ncbi:hypothetical protein TNCV_4258471 [Trichonephila clavipes]|nr:hypothetical protein TNCV_4258471 [Trichonephila clavipes]